MVSHYTTMLRRKDHTDLTDLDGTTLASIVVWPPQDDAIQEFTAIGSGGIEIEPGSSY